MKILSIDAWRVDTCTWTWNNWYTVGNIDLDKFDTTRKILKELRDMGLLSDYSKGRVYINDDQYNLVICDSGTHEPIFAIEYGSEY